MRKYIKKQVLEICSAMGRANELLRRGIEIKNIDCVMGMLCEQQDAAVRIGEVVEQTEGEGHHAVKLLEEYYELLWQISQTNDQLKQLKLSKQLRHLHIQVENSLKWEIPVQYEVVFLPYKASMWDSLESVWMAAKEDNDCSCRVIPIPYYNKNPDGSFREQIYEGDLFPKYVPITDYREYSLEEIQPEVVFFHNPYDHNNSVTSVAPEFYSDRLRNQTDMLVYIPYYIEIEDVGDNQCITPGVLNAHKVIVQSESVRQTYLRVWKTRLGYSDEQALKAGFYEKISALGSPKIDKVIHTKRENTVLPDEWEEKIYGGAKNCNV